MPIAFGFVVGLMVAVCAAEEINQIKLAFTFSVVRKENRAGLALPASHHHVPLTGFRLGEPDH